MWWVRGVSILTCKRMFFVSVMIFVWGRTACYVFEYADMLKLSVLKPSEAFLCDRWICCPQT